MKHHNPCCHIPQKLKAWCNLGDLLLNSKCNGRFLKNGHGQFLNLKALHVFVIV